MGVAIRHLLIDPSDEVLSLDNRLFDKLWDNAPVFKKGDSLLNYLLAELRQKVIK